VRDLAKDLKKPVSYYAGAVWNKVYLSEQIDIHSILSAEISSIRYPIKVGE
jgi:hypothetical protein